MFLEKIESPADLKALSAAARRALVEEMRAALLKRASIHGGHFGSAFGIDATLVNPLFISGQDEALLEELKKDHTLVVTMEDGILDGGFGEKIARFYGTAAMRVKNYGVKKGFYDRYDTVALARENHLTPEQIAADVMELLG